MKSDIVNAEVLSRISAFEIVKYADNASEGIMDMIYRDRLRSKFMRTNAYDVETAAIIEANFVARGYEVQIENDFGGKFLYINW